MWLRRLRYYSDGVSTSPVALSSYVPCLMHLERYPKKGSVGSGRGITGWVTALHDASTRPSPGPLHPPLPGQPTPCLRPGPRPSAASTTAKGPAAMDTSHPLGARESPYSPAQAPGPRLLPPPEAPSSQSGGRGPWRLAPEPSRGPPQAPETCQAGAGLCSCPRGASLPSVRGTPPALGCRPAGPPTQPSGEAETPR